MDKISPEEKIQWMQAVKRTFNLQRLKSQI